MSWTCLWKLAHVLEIKLRCLGLHQLSNPPILSLCSGGMWHGGWHPLVFSEPWSCRRWGAEMTHTKAVRDQWECLIQTTQDLVPGSGFAIPKAAGHLRVKLPGSHSQHCNLPAVRFARGTAQLCARCQGATARQHHAWPLSSWSLNPNGGMDSKQRLIQVNVNANRPQKKNHEWLFYVWQDGQPQPRWKKPRVKPSRTISHSPVTPRKKTWSHAVLARVWGCQPLS